ncbi:MAG: hypothetical protein KDE33_20825 [Bacteroidetes bacterium]|nr:hypothetical protein [Bacteroidota bacterium]
MNLTLRKVSINERLSEETTCFCADICLDGKKVGIASNRGHGDTTLILWEDLVAGLKIEEYAKSLPSIEYQGLTIESNIDILIDDLLTEHVERKMCKNKTVFILTDTPKGSYLSIKEKYNPDVGQWLRKEYGSKLVSVLNEKYGR